MPKSKFSLALIIFFAFGALVSHSHDAYEEEQAPASPLNVYSIHKLHTATIILGILGISVGTFMAAGADCIYHREHLSDALCIVGIITASVSGLVFVGGSGAAGLCYLYNYYVESNQEQLNLLRQPVD